MELVMGMKDVFINLVGGLKVDDPAADLSILCAIASSFMDKPIDENIVFMGEIGLAGEVRSISRLGHRLSEVMALGFSGAVVPEASMNNKIKKSKLKIYPVTSVRQAFDILF
jgi:DNA repair protein RadA/Sms